MDGKVRTIHQRWKQRSEAAFERMISGKGVAEMETLAQREEEAVAIARELALFLLEEQLSLDEAVQPSEPASACCPKCGRSGTPAVRKGEKLPERRVVTRIGEVAVRRQRWRCAKCRVIFFSAGREAAAGDGRL